MNAIVPRERMQAPIVIERALPMTAEAVRDHVNLVQQVMRGVMKPTVHYGQIPGTDKNTLYKPGAELLCMAFHIEPSYAIEDLSGPDFYRYRVRCIGTHQGSGVKLGEGMGSCSSNEEKYKWRRTYDRSEYNNAPEGRRRLVVKRSGDGGTYNVMQVRTEHDDIDNTVLKMACKRAMIAMTLNVTAASDIFAQDIEDLPEHLRTPEDDEPQREPVEMPRSTKHAAPPAQQPPVSSEGVSAEHPTGHPQPSAGAAPTPPSTVPHSSASAGMGPTNSRLISEGAKTTLRRRLKDTARTDVDACAKFGVSKIDDMTFDQFQAAMKWLTEARAVA